MANVIAKLNRFHILNQLLNSKPHKIDYKFDSLTKQLLTLAVLDMRTVCNSASVYMDAKLDAFLIRIRSPCHRVDVGPTPYVTIVYILCIHCYQ